MKYKKTLLTICIISCVLFSISAVMASDVNETVITNEDENQIEGAISANTEDDFLSTSDNGEETISQTDNNVLTYSVQVSSYSDLTDKIEQAKNTNYANYTINLENKEYVATKDMITWGPSGDTGGTKILIINGNGATLNGDNKYSFIRINQDYTLVLNNIKLINFAKYGEYGSIVDIYGGAIFVDTLGTLTINNCEFENNHAKIGGAIYSSGILVIRKTIFTKNTAESEGGAIEAGNGNCDIQTSLFESNNAKTGGAIYSGVNGAIIANNIFTKNEAEKGGGAIHNGYWEDSSYSTVIYDQWGNRIEGEREYFGLNTNMTNNTFAYNKAGYGSAINNVVKSVLIDSNNFYSNSVTSSSSEVIVNNAEDVEISNNVMKGTNYYSTISNSDSYSKISNNVFDNTPNTIFSIPGAGTYKTSTSPTSDSQSSSNSSSSSSSETVTKTTPKLTANAVTKTYGTSTKLVVYLKDNKGNAISNQYVTVVLAGVTKSIKTNSNGQATLAISNAPGSYTAKITYGTAQASAKITVKKATPKLTAKAKTFKQSVKTKNFVVTLKTNQNKVMKNTKVTLKVNGKTYSAKTNTKGQATFKITKLIKKGKFTSTIKYAGSKYYNAKTVKAKITVK